MLILMQKLSLVTWAVGNSQKLIRSFSPTLSTRSLQWKRIKIYLQQGINSSEFKRSPYFYAASKCSNI